MINFRQPIPNGFGNRLKEERKRIRLSQTELADIADTGRLTQYQYEQEVRSPNIKYLSAISSVGIDLAYLLYGVRTEDALLSLQEKNEIEKKALSLLVKNEAELGNMDDERRFVMFNLLRSQLIEMQVAEIKKEHVYQRESNGQA